MRPATLLWRGCRETQAQPAATEMFARDMLQPLARNLVQIVPVTRFHSQSAEARTASQVRAAGARRVAAATAPPHPRFQRRW